MDMTISFPGGARVNAEFGGYTVQTDQPVQGGGEGSAPTPFAMFLSSIGTCAGIYVLGFCNQRGLSTDGIRIVQRSERDPQTGLIGTIRAQRRGAAVVPGEVPRRARPGRGPVRGEEAPRAPADVRRQNDREGVVRGAG